MSLSAKREALIAEAQTKAQELRAQGWETDISEGQTLTTNGVHYCVDLYARCRLTDYEETPALNGSSAAESAVSDPERTQVKD